MNSKFLLVFLLLLLSGLPTILLAQQQQGKLAAKPLFRDPVYDGAADPTVIWNQQKPHQLDVRIQIKPLVRTMH
jgi:hypothetical protein